jgi:hypothetical protein
MVFAGDTGAAESPLREVGTPDTVLGGRSRTLAEAPEEEESRGMAAPPALFRSR